MVAEDERHAGGETEQVSVGGWANEYLSILGPLHFHNFSNVFVQSNSLVFIFLPIGEIVNLDAALPSHGQFVQIVVGLNAINRGVENPLRLNLVLHLFHMGGNVADIAWN